MNGLSGLMVEHVCVKFGDPSCIGFGDIVWKSRQTAEKTAPPRPPPAWVKKKELLYTGRRAGDVVAVAELADPVGSVAGEMPRSLDAFAADRHVLTVAFHPAAVRRRHVRTPDSCIYIT